MAKASAVAGTDFRVLLDLDARRAEEDSKPGSVEGGDRAAQLGAQVGGDVAGVRESQTVRARVEFEHGVEDDRALCGHQR
ncbi:hypothetical protein NONI108955_35040 [Nocardia ninae]|uniref:Uncharacterized protein n=1 Tax=Nocardia ninae NBRC 108245 TaxID=1210091 RepID=A0A511M8M0_9NOCA|nr:hypothetical protein NN4_14890 [Nocardia ninae NBRC 108245]